MPSWQLLNLVSHLGQSRPDLNRLHRQPILELQWHDTARTALVIAPSEAGASPSAAEAAAKPRALRRNNSPITLCTGISFVSTAVPENEAW